MVKQNLNKNDTHNEKDPEIRKIACLLLFCEQFYVYVSKIRITVFF